MQTKIIGIGTRQHSDYAIIIPPHPLRLRFSGFHVDILRHTNLLTYLLTYLLRLRGAADENG